MSQPRTMWHGSLNLPTTFRPLSHFGTQEAAQERLVLSAHRLALGTVGSVQAQNVGLASVMLDVRSALEIRDDGHEHRSVTGLSRAVVEVGVMDIGWHRLVAQHARTRGAAAAAEKVARDLMEEGYDHLTYTNAMEDQGSVSAIVLDPARIHILGRRLLPGLIASVQELLDGLPLPSSQELWELTGGVDGAAFQQAFGDAMTSLWEEENSQLEQEEWSRDWWDGTHAQAVMLVRGMALERGFPPRLRQDVDWTQAVASLIRPMAYLEDRREAEACLNDPWWNSRMESHHDFPTAYLF